MMVLREKEKSTTNYAYETSQIAFLKNRTPGQLAVRFRPSTRRAAAESVITDPTVFNDAERLRTFVRSSFLSEKKFLISSDLYRLVRKEDWTELSDALCKWERGFRKREILSWHASDEFRLLCQTVVDSAIDCRTLLSDIGPDERETLEIASEIVGFGSPWPIRISKELIVSSVVKRIPVLSYTRHAKEWFKRSGRVVVLEISDAKNSISRVKTGIKKKVEQAGWSGYVFVFVFGLAIDKAFEAALPSPVGEIIGYANGASFVVGVIADGKKRQVDLT